MLLSANANLVLLGPQSLNGFDLCRPSRRQIAGTESHGEQENRYANHGQQVMLGDSIKETANYPGGEVCRENSQEQAGNQKSTGLAQDHAKNVSALRTQGEADANLPRPLAHAITGGGCAVRTTNSIPMETMG